MSLLSLEYGKCKTIVGALEVTTGCYSSKQDRHLKWMNSLRKGFFEEIVSELKFESRVCSLELDHERWGMTSGRLF